jgi:hypothetical protein
MALPEALYALHEAELAHKDERIAGLELENDRLRAELDEMTQFLSDYGLRWVGSRRRPSVADKDAAQHAPAQSGPPVDMARVREAVDELNAIAGDGSSTIIGSARLGGRGAVVGYIEALAPLPLLFWADGLQVGDHPVRPYADAEVCAFLSDLCDGYFPYEMRFAFPEGTRFELRERLSQRSDAQGGAVHEWGQGRLIKALEDAAPVRSAEAVAVVDPRVELRAASAHRRPVVDGLGGASRTRASVLLQIRSDNGEPLCQLCLAAETTIAELRAELVRRGTVAADGWRSLELRTSFPRRAYGRACDGESLEQVGFAPTATLHLHRLLAPEPLSEQRLLRSLITRDSWEPAHARAASASEDDESDSASGAELGPRPSVAMRTAHGARDAMTEQVDRAPSADGVPARSPLRARAPTAPRAAHEQGALLSCARDGVAVGASGPRPPRFACATPFACASAAPVDQLRRASVGLSAPARHYRGRRTPTGS